MECASERRGLSLSYLLAKKSTSLIGGFFDGSCSDARRRRIHSCCGTASNCNPASLSNGSRSRVQWKELSLTTFMTPLSAAEHAISVHALATTSTGSQYGFSSSAGKAPIVCAVWKMRGIASVSFHTPCCVSPMICPTRRTRAFTPVCRDARLQRCSVTSFDCAYPMPCA